MTSSTAPAPTMTFDQASDFRGAYARVTVELSRKSRAALAALEAAELAAAGTQRLYGGPQSASELINSLLDLRGYTIAKFNESTHVLHHRDNAGWSACVYCHPHGGAPCDCELSREGWTETCSVCGTGAGLECNPAVPGAMINRRHVTNSE